MGFLRKRWLLPLPDVDFEEGLSAMGNGSPKPSAQQLFTFFTTFYVQIRCFTILQRMARADFTTTFFEHVGRGFHAEPDGSQACQYESQVVRTQVHHAQSPHLQHQRQPEPPSLASFLSLDTVNTIGNRSNPAATLVEQCAKLNAAHRITTPALVSTAGERGT